jgi:peptide/nickel transport system ATP-binding protein
MTTETAVPVLTATGMRKHFAASRGVRSVVAGRRVVHAVDDATVVLAPGEIVAVVGESGSGKTTLGRLMSRLELPTAGSLQLNGTDVPRGGARSLRAFRRRVQVVFQDPYASLNSAHKVSYHLERPLLLHKIAASGAQARTMATELLDRVGLAPGRQFLDRYPQQLSGGQRQRVAIARALATGPQAIIADEPVASLDVSSRLAILNLFESIARDGASLLYITHDIASARYFADRIIVMYAGQIIEQGPAEDVVSRPQHPYTQLLIDSAPDPARRHENRRSAERAGEIASLITPPSGCRFHPRCPQAMAVCSAQAPPDITTSQHRRVACWLHADASSTSPNSEES